MGSPITFSGFNNIDFNVVLNAIMTQESRPLTALQTRQRAIQTTDSALTQLASKLGTLQDAATTLSRSSSAITYKATATDTAAIGVSASSSAVAGTYSVVVNELARAQVTTSSSTTADTDTTIVASGGTLTIGGVAVSISGPTTLSGLASAINAETTSPASASIVETAPGAFRLVLTSKDTGTANAFTIQNALSGSTVTFTDTDNDNISGDSAGDNAAQATDASVTINSVAITSSSNTLDSGIPGVTLALQQKDASKTITVTVTRDDDAIASRLETFASAYNDLVKFANDQQAAANKGTQGTLGKDALLRNLRSQLRTVLLDQYGSGTFTHLAEVGLEFTRTGEIKINREALNDALSTSPSSVASLFTDSTNGAFKAVDTLIDEYTQSGGLLPGARERLSDELTRIDKRMDDLEARLAVRRQSLQQQFIAADLAMTRLKSQQGSLSSFSTSLSNNSL
jgi:flagellar hook-associated protein 2